MYLNPMGHSMQLAAVFGSDAIQHAVVLKARTTSPGHFLRSSSQRSRTAKHLCESTKLPSSATAPMRSASPSVAKPGMAFFFHHRFLQHFNVRLEWAQD